METQVDHEKSKYNVHEDGAFGLSGNRVLPPATSEKAARGVRSVGLEIVVTTRFQY